jgi:GNAT superfamily N-acetyltransferase
MPSMEFELLGWPADGPTLELDWRSFAYAGKFVVSGTGKAVARDDGTVVGALAFDEDRTDPAVLVVRYVTVRDDRQGEGIGSRLLAFGRELALERAYERVRISVNNPAAYVASYRAGFRFIGRTSGVAELVLEWPAPSDGPGFEDGLRLFADRDLDDQSRRHLERRLERGPPDAVSLREDERGVTDRS